MSTPQPPALQPLTSMSPQAISIAQDAERLVGEAPQVDVTTLHSLHGGVYTRTVIIPQDVTLVGALIVVPTTLIISGHLDVFIGDEVRRVDGVEVIEAEANRKQVMHARKETCVTMVFQTRARTVDEAEREFTPEYDKLMSRRQS